jgi:3-oxoacyl-[acyl-carrier-protein] synthase II
MSPKDIRKFDPFVPFGFAAAVQAVKDSGIEVTEENSPRIGVAIGAGIGGLSTIEENTEKWLDAKSPRKISPFFIPGSIINAAAGQVSIHYGCVVRTSHWLRPAPPRRIRSASARAASSTAMPT